MTLSNLYSAGIRSVTAIGFLADIEKYFEAALAGWTDLRLSECQLSFDAVEWVVLFVKNATCTREIGLPKSQEPAKA